MVKAMGRAIVFTMAFLVDTRRLTGQGQEKGIYGAVKIPREL